MALDRADDADAGHVPKLRHRRKLSDLAARCGGDRLRDRVLRRRLHGSGEPQDLGAARAVEERDVRQLHPTLGDRSRLVEDDRRDAPRALEDLGALDEDPELRAASGADHERGRRREPERARARDDQHGDRRRERGGRVAGDATSQPTSVASESASTIGTKTLETRSTSRWIGAFPDCASATSLAICASAVSSPTFVARTTSRPNVLTVAPATEAPARDVDRYRLAREHRLVDRGLALDDDAVRRHLLARTDDEEIAGRELGDRNRDLDPVSEHAGLLRAELEERADRSARAASRPRLEVAPEQDQRRDHGGDLEVDVRVVDDDERGDRPAPGRERADRDERVHRGRAVPRVQDGSTVEVEPGPEDDRRREREREPLPALELQRHHHREDDERRREHGRHEKPPANGVRAIDGLARLGRRHGVVAGRLDRAEQIGDGDALGIEANGRLLGRVVHRGVDPVELVELALDPVRARGARHPLEREIDTRVALGRRDGVTPPRTPLRRSPRAAPRRPARSR